MKRFMLIFGLAMLTACERPAEPPAPPRPALVLTAGTTDAGTAMVLIGEVKPRFESAQGFRIDGKIVARKVEVGDRVKTGQILALLDPADTRLAAQASQADTRAAEAEYVLVQAEFERQRQLFERKFVSRSALDLQEARFKTAAARLAQVKALAAVSGNQSRYTAMNAARDGIVTDIRAEPGQVVSAGDVIAHVAGTDELEVAVAVPESRTAGIAVGTPAKVHLWATPDKAYAARVREIAPSADPQTRAFDVRVSVLDAGNEVRMGMTAGVSFPNHSDGALLLPSSVLSERDGLSIVWVVDSQTQQVQPRPVQADQFNERGVTITGGLEPGEQVVIAGLHALSPGMIVRPIQATP